MEEQAARPAGGLPARRVWTGLVVAVVGLGLATAALLPLRDTWSLASIVLGYLTLVVVVALVGGVWPALVAAIGSDLLVNYFFVKPRQTLLVESRDNAVTLVVYVLVAAAVSVTVEIAARNRSAAARSRTEAALVSRVSAERSVTAILTQVRDEFGMTSVALVDSGVEVARVGPPLAAAARVSVPAGDGLRLVAVGPERIAPDYRLLGRLATAAGRALENRRLGEQAARARELAEVDRLRAALLAAVGHDLRTPLAGIKAAVSSLREPDVDFTDEERAELLATIEESADRLDDLVANLLAMSRLTAGALSVQARPVALDEVVARALLGFPDVAVDVPDDLPLVDADPGLLERVIANLVGNAVRYSPPGRPVRVSATRADGTVALAVVDHGPGVPESARVKMFEPFQRLDDRTADGSLGLGLAIARGFTEAMGGTVAASDTPGGGLTMTVTLPLPTP